MNHLPAIITLLTTFFKNDEQKVAYWLDTINVNLGGLRPIDMIKLGKEKKLLKFIENAAFKGGWDESDQ